MKISTQISIPIILRENLKTFMIIITLILSFPAFAQTVNQDSAKVRGFEIKYADFQNSVNNGEFRIAEAKFNADSGLWKIGGWKNKVVNDCTCGSEYILYNVKVKEKDVIFEPYGGFSWIPKVSILSVPVKIRPSLKYTPKGSQEEVKRPHEGGIDLKNVNVGLNFYNKTIDRYFSYGTSTSHKWSGGILLGLSAIGLTEDNVNIKANSDFNEVTQLFVSTGLNVSYSYNTINFSLVPVAWDWAVSQTGRNYVYHKKVWFGFGVGIGLSRMGMPYGIN
ncbi:MAG: hypothetical protein ACQEW9_02240 [Bacteroidota bacterium]